MNRKSKNIFTDFEIDEFCKYCSDGKYYNAELLLLRYGENIANACDPSTKVTPLMYAAKGDNNKIISLLLKHGAHINMVDYGGNTALIYAVINNNNLTVKLLLRNRADYNLKNKNYRTALTIANERSFKSIISIIEDWDKAKVRAFVKHKKINRDTEIYKKRISFIKKKKQNNPFN